MSNNEKNTEIAFQYTTELDNLHNKFATAVRRLKESPQQKTALHLKQLLLGKVREYKERACQLDTPEKGRGRKAYESAIEEFRYSRRALESLAQTIHIWDDERSESRKQFREEFYPMNKKENRGDVCKIDRDTYYSLSQLARLHNANTNGNNKECVWAQEKDISFIVMDGDEKHINVNVFLKEIRSYRLDKATEEHTNNTYTPKKTMVFTLPKNNLIGSVLYYGIRIRNFWGGAECWERENHQSFWELV